MLEEIERDRKIYCFYHQTLKNSKFSSTFAVASKHYMKLFSPPVTFSARNFPTICAGNYYFEIIFKLVFILRLKVLWMVFSFRMHLVFSIFELELFYDKVLWNTAI